MSKTLRLVYPEWAAGNCPEYIWGARTLDFLAPTTPDMIRREVPVELYDGTDAPVEGGIFGRTICKNGVLAAKAIIAEEAPDRIITLGGNCLISQPSMDYLSGKYGEKFGLIWMDSHPDISTMEFLNAAVDGDVNIESAMVCGNLMGEGDPDFNKEVEHKIDPKRVMYAGLRREVLLPQELEIVERNGIRIAGPDELKANGGKAILKWIEDNGIEYVGIHCDLDVTDPAFFRAQLPGKPEGLDFETVTGVMQFADMARAIQDIQQKAECVGMTFSEHTPWDVINLHNFMASLPIFNK